jgi:PAS domain S-box-containing protein
VKSGQGAEDPSQPEALRRENDELRALHRLTDVVCRAASVPDVLAAARDCLETTLGATRVETRLFEGGSETPAAGDASASVLLEIAARVLGRIDIWLPDGRAPTVREEEVARLIAQHVGAAVDRERVDAELRRAAVVLDSVADGITVQDARGRLLYANDAAARLVGLPNGAAMRALPAAQIVAAYELLDEQGRPMPVDKLPGRIALTERREAEAVLRHRHRATGEEKWSVVHAAPVLDPSGELSAAVNIFRDVTRERRADEARRFVHDTTQEMTRSLDVDAALSTLARALTSRVADGCLIYLLSENGELERRVEAGADPTREALLRELRRFTVDHGVHSPPWKAIDTKSTVLAEDIDPDTLAAMARTPEWLELVRKLDVHSTLTVPLVARNEVLGAVGLIMCNRERTFTPELVQLAEALAERGAMSVLNARLYAAEQRARHEAEAAVRAREQLLAVVSHDLKTPLSAIAMAAGLLEGVVGADHVEGQRAAHAIARSVDNMRRLIADLLDLARINAGTLRIRKTVQDFETLMQESITLLAPLAEEKGQRLTFDGSLRGAHVTCDRERIVQVMTNLVGNAIKFTPEGGSVVVQVARSERGVEVRVRDDGPGIDPEELANVFDRYWQSGGADDRSGIGLGLSIAKGIVEAHGGAIHVESRPGRGSTFAFVLPG